MSSEQSSRKYFKSWSVARSLLSFSVICAGFSPATKTSRISQRYYAEFFTPNATFYNRVKETNPARKGGSRGNIFALSFKVTECHPHRHHGVFYVILRGEQIRKVPDAMIFAFYSVVIERTASEFGCWRAEKVRQKTDSGDELSSTRNENSDGSIWWRRLVADRKSRVAVFSA